MSLAAFPLPVPGESVPGYFFRLAKNNGFHNPENFFERIFGKQAYQYQRIRKEEFSRLTQHDASVMENLWLTYEDAFYIYKDVVLPKNHILKDHRWCPLCWQDNNIMKCAWQIGWMPICDVHNTLLLDQCSTCGGAIKYKNHLVACKNCGELLEHMESKAAPNDVLASQQRSVAAVWSPQNIKHYARNPVVTLVNQLLNHEEAFRRSSKSDRRAAPRAHFWMSVSETIERYQRVLSERAIS
jgi:hypothetical protein